MRPRNGFSLVEMLVVLATTSLLMALLHPGLSYARRVAREVVCGQDQHEVTIALLTYAAASKDRLPGIAELGGNSALFDSTGGKSYADVLAAERFVVSPRAFSCPVEEAAPAENLNSLHLGLNRYLAQNYGSFEQITDGDWCPPYWGERGVIAAGFGPRVSRIALPSAKLFLVDSADGSPDASLTAAGGLGLVRHQNFGANYSFLDGHTRRYGFADMYGSEYNPKLAPTEATSSTLLENLRFAGMVGGVTAKRYGEHYSSAETFSPWAPWDGGNTEVGRGWGRGGSGGGGGGSGGSTENNGHGNNDDGVDVSNPAAGGGGHDVDPSGDVDDERGGGGGSTTTDGSTTTTDTTTDTSTDTGTDGSVTDTGDGVDVGSPGHGRGGR